MQWTEYDERCEKEVYRKKTDSIVPRILIYVKINEIKLLLQSINETLHESNDAMKIFSSFKIKIKMDIKTLRARLCIVVNKFC